MGKLRKRMSFSRINEGLEMPDLIEVQKRSYQRFLETDLKEVLADASPITNYNGNLELTFTDYSLGEPKNSVERCRERDMTYAAPLNIHVHLYDSETSEIKETDVYMGDFPLMTENGTFVINGADRVIVSQLVRSPGCYYTRTLDKAGVPLYSSQIIPNRGAWLEYETDSNDIIWVRLDRARKLCLTTLLRALGYETDDDIRNLLGNDKRLEATMAKDTTVAEASKDRGGAVRTLREQALLIIYKKQKPDEPESVESATNMFKSLFYDPKRYDVMRVGRYKFNKKLSIATRINKHIIAEDIIDPRTGEVMFRAGQVIDLETARRVQNAGVNRVVVDCEGEKRIVIGNNFVDAAEYLPFDPKEVGILEMVHLPTLKAIIDGLGEDVEEEQLKQVIADNVQHLVPKHITDDDMVASISYLLGLPYGIGTTDDIDHLGNRRLRSVGELLQNQFRTGLSRMERNVRERMSAQDGSTDYQPDSLISIRPVTAAIKEFFGSSQLSQFMDQNNPLAELTHKRRLSALGPGGLNRDRASFEVRDVHYSHYSRICPIETPEGPNIGLIVSLTTYAKVNDYGFIETPYRVIRDGYMTDEFVHLDASRETGHVIAQANAAVDADRRLVDDYVTARVGDDVLMAAREEITLMDISPSQMVSISAALIPFLEHDDANRALMGSNMQRQAVPLLRSERPLVGTGMEVDVARDSGACILAESSGVVHYADANRIIVAYDDPALYPNMGGVRAYDLLKFHKSNQNSCFGQVPSCVPGQIVKKGDVLADGPAIHDGGLALGKNMLIAFMPWCGYNYEDSVLISERVVKEDIYTSVHIEEFEVVARDTKLGPEEITRDIPNVGEEMLRNLDESGIIRIGAPVKPEDILVGKITPKGETQLTPEEKLLRAIFGDKARDVKNTSLKVPPGVEGTVIDVKVFNRRSGEKDERTRNIEDYEISRLDAKEQDHIRAITRRMRERLLPIVDGKQIATTLLGDKKGEVLAEAGAAMTEELLMALPVKKLADLFQSKEVNENVGELLVQYDHQIEYIKSIYDSKREKVTEGDDLPPGVIKMVKVHIAIKRKLSVGDKMAGRHGNKGVVSRILPEEDMPFFADGRPVDIVLNPLGVPSRMNIGQIMEVHLGWAARELGRQLAEMVDKGTALQSVRDEVKDIFASPEIAAEVDGMDDEEFRKSVLKLRNGIITYTPVFDGAEESEIWNWLSRAGLDDDGKSVLYDGRTGEKLENRVTTGVMYYLKLHHLVDEKIHARSTGPYSLVTQQPLGGKAQFGGQRLGEMEVWALEAYGASYLLQEFLTVKSDDVTGRVKMYEKIVKGDNFLEAGLPESFNVLVKELMSLGLNVTLHQEEGKKRPKRVGFAEEEHQQYLQQQQDMADE